MKIIKINELFKLIKEKYELIKEVNCKLSNNFYIKFDFNLEKSDNSKESFLYLFCSDNKSSNINTKIETPIYPIFKLLLYSLYINNNKNINNGITSQIKNFINNHDQQYQFMAESIISTNFQNLSQKKKSSFWGIF